MLRRYLAREISTRSSQNLSTINTTKQIKSSTTNNKRQAQRSMLQHCFRIWRLPISENTRITVALEKQRNEPIMKSDEVLTNIAMPDVNDVLSGRGGLINKHPGNVQFIEMWVFEINNVNCTSAFISNIDLYSRVKSYRKEYVLSGEFQCIMHRPVIWHTDQFDSVWSFSTKDGVGKKR